MATFPTVFSGRMVISLARSDGTFNALAQEIVEEFQADREADVYNLIAKGVGDDPTRLAWALARVAASALREHRGD